MYVVIPLLSSDLALTDRDQAQCARVSALGAVLAQAKYGQH